MVVVTQNRIGVTINDVHPCSHNTGNIGVMTGMCCLYVCLLLILLVSTWTSYSCFVVVYVFVVVVASSPPSQPPLSLSRRRLRRSHRCRCRGCWRHVSRVVTGSRGCQSVDCYIHISALTRTARVLLMGVGGGGAERTRHTWLTYQRHFYIRSSPRV